MDPATSAVPMSAPTTTVRTAHALEALALRLAGSLLYQPRLKELLGQRARQCGRPRVSQ
jgi:hypothetical protein